MEQKLWLCNGEGGCGKYTYNPKLGSLCPYCTKEMPDPNDPKRKK